MASEFLKREDSVVDAVKKLGLIGRKQSVVSDRVVLYEYSDVAPSPSRDFCQIIVTKNEVIFRLWKISSRNDAKTAHPVQYKDTYEEFLEDDRIQSEIHRTFGKNMVDYVKNLCHGHIDYLTRLPRRPLIKIASYLGLQDIARLGQTSKQFREICNSDDLWEIIYRCNSETPVTPELVSLAEEQGWKKLFFTNKLQLQKQISRIVRSQTPNGSIEFNGASPSPSPRTSVNNNNILKEINENEEVEIETETKPTEHVFFSERSDVQSVASISDIQMDQSSLKPWGEMKEIDSEIDFVAEANVIQGNEG